MFVKITNPKSYWYEAAEVNDIVEVKPKNASGRYQLVISKHNDDYFGQLRKNEPPRTYVNGIAHGMGDYRTCWIAEQHCIPYSEPQNNDEALALLLEEE